MMMNYHVVVFCSYNECSRGPFMSHQTQFGGVFLAVQLPAPIAIISNHPLVEKNMVGVY